MWYIIVSLIFNAIDFISGIIAGYKKDGKLVSSKMRDGLFKKFGFILCYILGYILSFSAYKINLDVNINVLPGICIYIIFTEIISILENISILNDKLLPEKIKKIVGGDITNEGH